MQSQSLTDQFNSLFSIITPIKVYVPPSQPTQPSQLQQLPQTQPQPQTQQLPQIQQTQQPQKTQSQPLTQILPTPSPQGAIPPSTTKPSVKSSAAVSSQNVASEKRSPDYLSEEKDYNVKINSSIEYDGNQKTNNYLAGIDENGKVYYKEEKSV